MRGSKQRRHTATSGVRRRPGTRLFLETLEDRTAPAVGLVAAYGFNEGLGLTANDASGTGNNGALAGPVWNAAGRFGQALSFDGINDWVTVPDANSLDLTTGLTVEAWVRPTDLSGWRTVVIKEIGGGEAYTLYASEGSVPVAYINVSGDLDAPGTTSLTLNTWTHLAATYDNAALRLYVNGSQVGSRALTGSIIPTSGPLRIGGNAPFAEFFKGLIDEVRVYNRALSPAEIQQDMDTPIDGAPVDTTPPAVTTVAPPASAVNVVTSVNVTATFSEALNPSSVNSGTFELRDAGGVLVAASISYSGLTATLDPTALLAANTTYMARVIGGASSVMDVAGNALAADFTWSFTTAPPPTPRRPPSRPSRRRLRQSTSLPPSTSRRRSARR
jgi:hypothetical protein